MPSFLIHPNIVSLHGDSLLTISLRDWSLITGSGGGGGVQNRRGGAVKFNP